MSATFSEPANGGGFLLVLAISLPTAGMLLSLALGGRLAARTALALLPAGLGVAIAVTAAVWRTREPLVYYIGAWAPPLGLTLRADGLSAAMLATTAIVICATGLYGRAAFRIPAGMSEPVACLSLLIVAIILGALMLAG